MSCPDRDCVACRELACANPACDRERRTRVSNGHINSPRCGACAVYWSRHGVERPATLIRHGRANPATLCANPACDMPRARSSSPSSGHYARCHACRIYLWRNGVERPARLANPRAAGRSA